MVAAQIGDLVRAHLRRVDDVRHGHRRENLGEEGDLLGG
jgi:hypothetical protein